MFLDCFTRFAVSPFRRTSNTAMTNVTCDIVTFRFCKRNVENLSEILNISMVVVISMTAVVFFSVHRVVFYLLS